MVSGKITWREFIYEVQKVMASSVRYTSPTNQGLIGGYQSIQVDLKDPNLEEVAERVIDKALTLARNDAFEQSYREQDYNKNNDDVQRKVEWITKSANALVSARENEREETLREVCGLIKDYFSSTLWDEAHIHDKLIVLITDHAKKTTLISLEEIEKMTGH